MLYEKLVEKILNCEKLRNVLDNMVFVSDSLNLVDPQWEKILKESSVYQKHLHKRVKFSKGKTSENKFHVRNIIGLENSFDVIVAGMWSFSFKEDSPTSLLLKSSSSSNTNGNNNNCNSSTSIMCRMCPPLVEIGNSMAEHDRLEISENCRFFMDICNISVCDKCAQYKRGYDTNYNDWCVKSTKVFDGENVKGMIKQSVEDAFRNNNFCGILRLNVYSRFTFNENRFKIGGKCLDMILFKENSLTNSPLSKICYNIEQQNTPCITYEEEVEEGKEENI